MSPSPKSIWDYCNDKAEKTFGLPRWRTGYQTGNKIPKEEKGQKIYSQRHWFCEKHPEYYGQRNTLTIGWYTAFWNRFIPKYFETIGWNIYCQCTRAIGNLALKRIWIHFIQAKAYFLESERTPWNTKQIMRMYKEAHPLQFTAHWTQISLWHLMFQSGNLLRRIITVL